MHTKLTTRQTFGQTVLALTLQTPQRRGWAGRCRPPRSPPLGQRGGSHLRLLRGLQPSPGRQTGGHHHPLHRHHPTARHPLHHPPHPPPAHHPHHHPTVRHPHHHPTVRPPYHPHPALPLPRRRFRAGGMKSARAPLHAPVPRPPSTPTPAPPPPPPRPAAKMPRAGLPSLGCRAWPGGRRAPARHWRCARPAGVRSRQPATTGST